MRRERIGGPDSREQDSCGPAPEDRISFGLASDGLGGGEDYELLFCTNDSTMDKVIEALGPSVGVIGRMVDGDPGVTVVSDDGTEVSVGSAGWDHFSGQHG